MQIIFTVLLIGSAFVAVGLAGIGFVGLIKRETWVMNKKTYTLDKKQGAEAIKYSLFYIFAGVVWGVYTYMRFIGW